MKKNLPFAKTCERYHYKDDTFMILLTTYITSAQSAEQECQPDTCTLLLCTAAHMHPIMMKTRPYQELRPQIAQAQFHF
jgi:hypothetical protein